MNTYGDFKNLASSEKISLAILHAAKRLVAFSADGDTYVKTDFDVAVIQSITVDGIGLIEVSTLGDLVSGSFYNDRTNKTLHIKLSDESNPAEHFLTLTQKLFFASAPVSLPWNLDNGFEVFWEPHISGTSSFTVEIDTVNQQNEAIEGAGTLTLSNDQSFWPKNFDKLSFDNQDVQIYSWFRGLAASEAKLVFRGKVDSRSFSSSKIAFKCKDLITNLKNKVSLKTIEELGLRPPNELINAPQRIIFGRVFGHCPTNVDSLIDGSYPLIGTVAATKTSVTITGTGTDFLKTVSPDDSIWIEGSEYTVAAVASDTSLTLTEAFTGDTGSGYEIEIIPEEPKRWINRVWNLAGHALREPTPQILTGSSTSKLFVTSTADINDGDELYVGPLGSGELVTVDEVINETTIKLANSLSTAPITGTTVTRPCVQNLRIDDTNLIYYRDYTVDASTAILTLRETAELNVGKTTEGETVTFTNGSRVVTGTGTSFDSYLRAGTMIRPKNTVNFFEILSVDSDTQITLRTPSDVTSTAILQLRSLIFDPSENILNCEVLGRTDTGLPGGSLLKFAPEIVSALLTDAGFGEIISVESFVATQRLVPEEISFVLPEKFSDTSDIIYRDVINAVGKSVFGILYQDSEFKFAYDVLRPVVPPDRLRLSESDILDFTYSTTNKNMISKATVEFRKKEYDYLTGSQSVEMTSSSSDTAKFILKTSKERTFPTVLVNRTDAKRLADRWKFLLENSTGSLSITTKLQTIDHEINDIIDVSHQKMFERFGGVSKRKIVAVESIKKSATEVTITAVDLSNAFNRIAVISDATTSWADSTEDTRIRTGFITDAGLIDNDEDSFNTNLIW